MAVFGKNAPRLADKFMEATMFEQQRGSYPSGRENEGLYNATGGGSVRGYNKPKIRRTSLYTQAQTRPVLGNTLIGLSLGAVGLGLGLLLTRSTKHSYKEEDNEFRVLPEWRYEREPREAVLREEAIVTEGGLE
ncbi:MAG: hypothetical protein ACRCYY_08870 [Trueperaceae bacterium]